MTTPIPEENKVSYNFLGRSGLKVSNIALGCATFGEVTWGWPGQTNEDVSHQIINRYVEWGGNFLDTADIYALGKSEAIIGTWLERQPRDKFVIATKCRQSMGLEQNINNVGLSRRHITESIEGSLKRLHTDFVDLYQIHMWDDGTPVEETLRALDDLVRAGKVRYVGLSNVTGWQMQSLVNTTERYGLNSIVSLQQQYSLASRDSELEAFQVCKAAGVGVLPWSPLKGGLLTGKVKRGVKPTEGRLGAVAADSAVVMEPAPHWTTFSDKTFDIIDTVEAIAKKHGRSIPQVALRWLLQKDVVSSVIIGAKNLTQLDDNMAAANGWSLTREEMKQLDDVSAPHQPYPYDMVFKLNADRVNPAANNFYVGSTNTIACHRCKIQCSESCDLQADVNAQGYHDPCTGTTENLSDWTNQDITVRPSKNSAMTTPISEENKVTYNFLGRSGLKVSNIALGCATFGEVTWGWPDQTNEEASHHIIKRYVEWGGNFLDTADVYARGTSETYVGTFLEKNPRDKFVIATKARINMGTEENINNVGLSRRHLTESIQRSLKRLHTDYVDLYQIHAWDDGTPVEETLRTLDDLVRAGKIRYIGLSNVTGWQLQKLVDTTERYGLNSIISLQQQYSLASRDSELEPFQVCKAAGIGVLPWSPLKGGLLTGKVKRGVKPTEGRIGAVASEKSIVMEAAPHWSTFDDKTFDIIDTVEAIAKKHGRSIPQVSLRWLLQKDVVSSVIIGAKSLAQLDDNMGAANGWSLTKEEMKQLDDVSAPNQPYPYDMVFKFNADRVNPAANNFYVGSTSN